MNIKRLHSKIEHCEKMVKLYAEEIEESEKQQRIHEMYMDIYGLTLNFLTTDWEDEGWSNRPKPPMKDFMKKHLSKEAFDFWDLHKDNLFDILIDEDSNQYLSEIEWNHRITR